MKLKFKPPLTYIKDTGLVIVLIFLLTAYWGKSFFFILPAIGMLIIVMTIPAILKPLAVAWYYLSVALGGVTNKIILTIIYWGVLTPVGIIRRWLGFDPMKRKAWKKGVHSVFTERNHAIISDDFKMPY